MMSILRQLFTNSTILQLIEQTWEQGSKQLLGALLCKSNLLTTLSGKTIHRNYKPYPKSASVS